MPRRLLLLAGVLFLGSPTAAEDSDAKALRDRVCELWIEYREGRLSSSMLVHLYVRRGTVFIPSVGMTESGLYIDLEPVDVVALRDHSAVEAAVARALARAPSRINTPSPFPRPVVLKYAKARSWVEFERDTATWAVDYEDGQFKIIPYRKSSDGGWDEDSDNAEGFPVGSEISDVARRMVELIGG